MPHLVIYQPHLQQTPLKPHHHRPLQPPPPPSTTSLFLRSGVVMRPPPPLLKMNRNARVVKCMANPRRVQMVAKQIMRELSDMLLTDKVIQSAVLPEAALGADRYLSSLTTISDVEVSSDLQRFSNATEAKICLQAVPEKGVKRGREEEIHHFVDKEGKDVAIAGLKSKVKYACSALGKRMKLRLTPEIRFIEDDSVERGTRVIEILDKLKEERRKEKSQGGDGYESSDLTQDDDSDWEDDDPEDEGIIYVK